MKKFLKKNKVFSKKVIIILSVMCALNITANAQRQTKAPNEFSIFGGGSYSFLYYKPTLNGVYGVSTKGFNADLGVSFTAFAGKYVGFHFGLGMGIYNIKALVDSFTFVTPHFADASSLFGEDQPYDLYTNLSGYDEKQKIYFLTIPVMLQFQTMPKRQHRTGINKSFYVMTGIKFNFLLKKQYEVEVQELKNMAYFTQLDNWADSQKFAGLGRFNGNTASGKLKSVMPVFSFEAGMKWYLSNRIILYTGAFFEYGLTDPTKDNREPFNNYYSEDDLKTFSLLKFSDRTNIMSAGIKLRLSFVNPSKCLPCR